MSSPEPFLARVCPHCGAAASATVEVASRQRAEALPLDDLVSYWNGFFKEKVFFSYARCGSCGLLFAPTFFDNAQLGRLYAGMPPNMESVPADALARTQRGYFDWLRANAQFRGGYLEVGADVGLFARNCVEAGGFDRYWLYEPNRDVAPALDAVVKGHDSEIIHDMTGFDAVPDGAVGAVVMIHVLDHLLDPLTTLKELRTKLHPGGKILIVTHDESSLLRRVFGAAWPPFCLQHPQLFQPSTIKKVLTGAGFSDVKVRRSVNHFPIAFLFKHLIWAVGLKWDKTPAFGSLSVGLRLGNMMTLASA